MDQQTFPNEAPSPPRSPVGRWAIKMILWALIGAVLGALGSLFRNETEGGLEPVVILAGTFALLGAILSLLVSSACKT